MLQIVSGHYRAVGVQSVPLGNSYCRSAVFAASCVIQMLMSDNNRTESTAWGHKCLLLCESLGHTNLHKYSGRYNQSLDKNNATCDLSQTLIWLVLMFIIGVQTLDTKHLSAEKSGCDVNVNDASLRRILRDIN